MIERLLALRQAALAECDLGIVREIDAQLAREGYVESVIPETTERATPPRPRGRPRKTPAV